MDSPRAFEYPGGMQTLTEYLDALASATPTPGGGSAATIVAATGAALVAMVARVTAEGAKSDSRKREAEALAIAADRLRAELMAAREADERAYESVVEALAMPRESDDQKMSRAQRLQGALADAAAEPLHAAALAVEALALAERARELDNKHLHSDVLCAASFARAALEASAANVRINHASMKNREIVDGQAALLATFEAQAEERFKAAVAD